MVRYEPVVLGSVSAEDVGCARDLPQFGHRELQVERKQELEWPPFHHKT